MFKTFFENKTVLITGGTGSLGRAIIRKLQNTNCNIVVFSRDEGKQALYFNRNSGVKTFIGDVRDKNALAKAFRKYSPDFVIHTAALKRIDDMEYFPEECIKTNIQGSINVAEISSEFNVKKCILVSTDKACLPANVYGASKFTAERLYSNFDYESTSTIFSSVRYGNVIASRGSFIPLWLGLLNDDKEILVTSLECTRFLFSLEDAVNTVISSLINSVGGEVFIPYFDSYTMEDIITSISKITEKEVRYSVIGMRPGEKLHEDMIAVTELPFTYVSEFTPGLTTEYCNKLLCILPQYSNKTYSLPKYSESEFNSSLFINRNIDHLTNLILKGIEDAKQD